ncbi:unnamed protein product, partial [Mesorhabditis spiculigera]
MMHLALTTLTSRRQRASYYQPPKKFPPAFVRRFLIRYPRAHLWGITVLGAGAFVLPVIYQSYFYCVMTPEEWYAHRTDHEAKVLLRQKYGRDLWFPSFLTKFFAPSVKKEDDTLLD